MAKKRTLTVTVTKKHIEKGTPGDSESCPIALALRDAGYDGVEVETGHASFTGPVETPFGLVDVQFEAVPSRKGDAFIIAFDRTEYNEDTPGKYKVPAPCTVELKIKHVSGASLQL